MSINDLAEFLFVKHNGESKIDVNLCGGIADVRDLYCFLIDLMCKGLVLSSGCDKIDLDNVSQELLTSVIKRMRCIGIDVHVSLDDLGGSDAPGNRIDLGDLYTSGAIASNINAYVFTITTPSKRISVQFSFANL